MGPGIWTDELRSREGSDRQVQPKFLRRILQHRRV